VKAAALGLYAVLSALLIGHGVLHHPGRFYLGDGNDAEIFIWMLRWWPHAIAAGHDPFAAAAVWAPSGVNLAWVTSVPGAALLAWPLTAAFGPVTAYNVLMLAGPALSAWTAYLLCRHVTRDELASLAGGFVYGFSSYELAQSLGHLHASFAAVPPLVALVLLRSATGELDRRQTLWRLTPLLVLQFAFSTELFLTLALAAGGALLLAGRIWPDRREAVREALRRGLWAGGLCALLVSPYLVEAALHLQTGAINSPFTFSADLANLVVPTRLTLAGGQLAGPLSDRFRGNLAENGAYLGLPLLAIVVLLARERWREPRVRFLTWGLGLSVLAALGPVLSIAGTRVLPLPWLPLAVIPVFENVLPVRLMLYASLAAALCLALYLAARPRTAGRVLMAALALVALLPAVRAPYWSEPGGVPPLLASKAAYEREIPKDANVLVLPFGAAGHGMLWQARADFWFRQADGYVTPDPPPAAARYPIVETFLDAAPGSPGPEYAPALRRFLRERKVDVVLLDATREAAFGPLLRTLGVTADRVGGLLVYRLHT
jgi:hypothetical protein